MHFFFIGSCRENYEHGWDKAEAGSAFSVYHKGEKVVDIWAGYADYEAEVLWKEDTMSILLSTTKGNIILYNYAHVYLMINWKHDDASFSKHLSSPPPHIPLQIPTARVRAQQFCVRLIHSEVIQKTHFIADKLNFWFEKLSLSNDELCFSSINTVFRDKLSLSAINTVYCRVYRQTVLFSQQNFALNKVYR